MHRSLLIKLISQKCVQYLGIATFLITSTTQCSSCFPNAATSHNTVELALSWEQTPQVVVLNGLDLEKNMYGITGYIPNENATYFLNAEDGAIWKFTEEGNILNCQPVANIRLPLNLNTAFSFLGQSEQKQALFVGNIDPITHTLSLNKFTSGNLTSLPQESLDKHFQGYVFEQHKLIASCTITAENGDKRGCLIFCIHQRGSSTNKLACLSFDPSTASWSRIDVADDVQKKLCGSKFAQLTGAIEVVPGKLFLGRGIAHFTTSDQYNLLEVKENTLHLLSQDIENNECTVKNIKFSTAPKRPSWQIFTLSMNEEAPRFKPIFSTHIQDKERILCAPDKHLALRKLNLPEELTTLNSPSKNSLVIPFNDALYLLTSRTKEKKEDHEEDVTENIAYKAKLAPRK